MRADGACRQMSPAREMAPRVRGAYVVSGQRLMCDDVEQAPRRRPVQRPAEIWWWSKETCCVARLVVLVLVLVRGWRLGNVRQSER